MITISYTFEDEDGINPTGEPAELEFDIVCDYVRGCAARIHWDEYDHPEEPDEVDIVGVELIETGILRYTDSLKTDIEKWFLTHANRYLFDEVYELVQRQLKDDREYAMECKYDQERDERHRYGDV